jgi:hypothetical protein
LTKTLWAHQAACEQRSAKRHTLWHAEKDPENLWKVIVKTHKIDYISNINEVINLAAIQ